MSWKILLADDDAEDREIMKEALSSINAGEVIFFAENGEHALTLLDSNYRLDSVESIPQLIILDLNMPRMNGTHTLSRLKEDARFHNIPVIIYSTSINPLEKEKCMALGAHSYITKPTSFNESIQTAQTFLGMCG